MAITSVGSLGAAQNKTTSTSINLVTSTSALGGSLVVVAIAKDNVSSVDGETNEVISVTDSNDNTWTKAYEYCNGNGAANAGAIIAVFYSVLKNGLSTGATITATFSVSRTAKAISAWNYSINAGSTIEVVSKMGREPGSGASPFTNPDWAALGLPVTGATTKEALGFFAHAAQVIYDANKISTATWTRGESMVSCTIISSAGPTGGSTASNMMISGFFGIFPPGSGSIKKSIVNGSAGGNNVELGIAFLEVKPTTWNPLDKSSPIVLSNGNLSATQSPDGTFLWRGVRALNSKNTGTWSFTGTVDSASPFGGNAIFGFAWSGYNLDAYLGQDGYAIGIEANTGDVYRNNAPLVRLGSFTTVECEINAETGDTRFKLDGGAWNGPYTSALSSADPPFPMVSIFNSQGTTADFTSWDDNTPAILKGPRHSTWL